MSSKNVKFFHQKKFSKAITMSIIKINKIVYDWRMDCCTEIYSTDAGILNTQKLQLGV